MEKDIILISDKPAGESIIIPDECGNSRWDKVLKQEVKTCEKNSVPENKTDSWQRILQL